MARKVLSWKVPSVETISTGLTYAALTGALLTPVVTAAPRLPPPVEAKATSARPPNVEMVRSRTDEVASKSAPLEQARQDAAEPLRATADEERPARELKSIKPSLIAEVRARLKTIRAKDAAVKAIDHPDPTPEPPQPRIVESKSEPSKAPRTEDRPPPTATVPVASTKPVDPAPPTSWTDGEMIAALKECLRLLAPVSAEVIANPAMRQGDCGTPAPILLKSIGTDPKVTFQPAVEVNCPMAVAIGEWAKDTLQPAARDAFGSDVTRIVNASGYSCRNRYGLADERLSEHALANAIDIGGFGLANGRVVKVSSGWGTTARDRIAAKAAEKAEKEAKAKDKAKDDDDAPAKSPTIKAEKATTSVTLKGEEARASKKNKSKDEPKVTDAKVVEPEGTVAPEGRFLRRLHTGACETFGTVLGPEANEAHRDHLHLDLKARKRRAVCH